MSDTNYDVVLAEKCGVEDCPLFVERNEPKGPGVADFVHLHRGDEADEALEEKHEAQPSGMLATLDVWRRYGPPEMRVRFVD